MSQAATMESATINDRGQSAGTASRNFCTPSIFWVNVLVGMIFVAMNFPRLIETQLAPMIGYTWLRDGVIFLSRTLTDAFQGVVPSDAATFRSLMTLCFLGFAVYLPLVLFLSITRLKIGPVLGAIAGLVLGILSVHVLAWLVIGFVWAIAMGASVFAAIAAFVTWLIITVFRDAGLMIALAAAALLLWVLRAHLLRVLGVAVALVVIGLLLFYVAPPVFAFLAAIGAWIADLVWSIIGPVFRFIGALLAPIGRLVLWFVETILAPLAGYAIAAALFVVVVVLLLGASAVGFASMGNLVTDQLRSAFRVRRIGTRSHTLNGFALGSALALVLFTSVSAPRVSDGIQVGLRSAAASIDQLFGGVSAQRAVTGVDPSGAFKSIMPSAVRSFADRHMRSAQAPFFDATLLVAILALSILNVALSIIGMGAQERGDDKALFGHDVVRPWRRGDFPWWG